MIMRIVNFCDIHGDPKYLKALSSVIEESDVVVIAGDISGTNKPESAHRIISYIEKYNKNILAVHGNWDNKDVIEMLDRSGYNLHGKGRTINGFGFFGVGGSSPTPMKTPTEYSEEEIYDLLRRGFEEIKKAPKKILVSHPPPRNTRDRTFLGLRGGSKSVRGFIENNSIDICFCGHIHESHGIELLGGCLIANPGPFKKGKIVLTEIEAENILTSENIEIKKLNL